MHHTLLYVAYCVDTCLPTCHSGVPTIKVFTVDRLALGTVGGISEVKKLSLDRVALGQHWR